MTLEVVLVGLVGEAPWADTAGIDLVALVELVPLEILVDLGPFVVVDLRPFALVRHGPSPFALVADQDLIHPTREQAEIFPQF